MVPQAALPPLLEDEAPDEDVDALPLVLAELDALDALDDAPPPAPELDDAPPPLPAVLPVPPQPRREDKAREQKTSEVVRMERGYAARAEAG